MSRTSQHDMISTGIGCTAALIAGIGILLSVLLVIAAILGVVWLWQAVLYA